MMYSTVASKYALALYNVSKANKKTKQYKELLKALVEIYESISPYLNNQSIKPEQRVQAIFEVI
ncbi:MAG: F0F1 ATP synthase subunit delta, partial [Fervidobacterium sp.]